MKCKECGCDKGQAELDGLCPECDEACPIAYSDKPEDEDLVTKDYRTFYRYGMGKVAFEVQGGEVWQDAAKKYMQKTEHWPDIWLEGESGGFRNITMEGP